jgi:hypothetical protein
MVRHVHFLVEGPTEKQCVDRVLTPLLQSGDTYVTVSIFTTRRVAAGPDHKGGVARWARLQREVDLLLRQDTSIDVLTTLFDFYRFPSDSPGMNSMPAADPVARVCHVEKQVRSAIGDDRFRPNLVLHELEAWVLACRRDLADYLGDPALSRALDEVVASAGGPENVDDGPTTSPSRRLIGLYPGYVKAEDGPAALELGGFEKVLSQCPHASEWWMGLKS